VISFGRYEGENARRQQRRAHTFDFLGFTHYCDQSRKGKFIVGRQTSRKKFRKRCQELRRWLKAIRSMIPVKEWWPILKAKLTGHYQYYGVSGNYRALARYYHHATRLAFQWLNRRSQRQSYAFRQDARHLAVCGHAGDGQRGSGHSAVSWRQPAARHRTGDLQDYPTRRGGQQTTYDAGGCVPALKPVRPWEDWPPENYLWSRGQNRTRENRPSGIAGRLMETWAMGVGLRPVWKPADMPPNPNAVAHHDSIPTSTSPVP